MTDARRARSASRTSAASSTAEPAPLTFTRRDVTAIRSQSALTTSTGTSWLVVGGLFTVIALGLLGTMVTMPGAGTVALVGAIAIGILYLGMVVARVALPAGPRRLGRMAAGMLLIAGVSLLSVVIVALSAWSTVPV